MPDFDAIIIGTGQAGPSLAFRLAGAGMKVAVVERHLVGGTCVNTGCTPTKALAASAYAARIARRAAEYGVVIGGDIGIDMRRVKARMDAIVAASRNGLTSALENAANITVYRGHARFASPQAVEVALCGILVDGDSKEILGASLLGIGCDEAVHAILDLMYAKAPYTVMQRAMHIHPTVSELLPTILGDLKPVG